MRYTLISDRMDKTWFVKRTNPEFIDYLSRSSSISPITAQVLINRGINTPEQVSNFFNTGTDKLSDPLELPGMEKALYRIRKAVKAGESVLVHGDYDADGITATAIVLSTLKKLGIECDYFIPNRVNHGYGFNRTAVDIAKKSGAGLIITVDCGINSFEEVKEADSAGIDVIITDHHEPYIDINGSFSLPEAYSVVNPKLMSDGTKIPLCGAGIALKMSQGLLGLDESLELFDLAAIGTVADMVPLVGDNRIIIRKGLELINNNARYSIEALRDVASLRDRNISTGLLSYTLIPRINAAGRISEASEVVQFFTSDNRDEVSRKAQALNNNNARRKKIEESVYKEALSMLKEKSTGNSIILHNEGWHEGVIGIVASRLVDTFQRPAFIFSVKDGLARGSARSVPPFDICEGLTRCSDLLIRHGGHKQAAGLTINIDNMDNFERRMNNILSDFLKSCNFRSDLLIDTEVSLKDINFSLLRELARIEPFGHENEEPLFASRGLKVMSPQVVRSNHLKMMLSDVSHTIDAIGFNMGGIIEHLTSHAVIDAAFVPTINDWSGGKSLQLQIKAVRYPGINKI
ncbi:MAG: single-stranded-DNA-specific exonuclease RecJ [Thermodesulfovibrionales bacterium]